MTKETRWKKNGFYEIAFSVLSSERLDVMSWKETSMDRNIPFPSILQQKMYQLPRLVFLKLYYTYLSFLF
jgi:hypothetical protein